MQEESFQQTLERLLLENKDNRITDALMRGIYSVCIDKFNSINESNESDKKKISSLQSEVCKLKNELSKKDVVGSDMDQIKD